MGLHISGPGFDPHKAYSKQRKRGRDYDESLEKENEAIKQRKIE